MLHSLSRMNKENTHTIPPNKNLEFVPTSEPQLSLNQFIIGSIIKHLFRIQIGLDLSQINVNLIVR